MTSVFIGVRFSNGANSLQFQALAEEFARRGHQVVLLVPKSQRDRERSGNPAVYAWPSERPTTMRDAIFLFRLIHAFRPFLLIGNFGAVSLMMMLGRIFAVPERVAWYHTMSGANTSSTIGSSLKAAVQRLRKKFVYACCTQIVAVSNAAHSDLVSCFPSTRTKSRVEYNSYDDPGDTDPLDVQNRFVCVGGLTPWKGQDVLIRAIASVSRGGHEISVDFAGEGPERVALEKLAVSLGVRHLCHFHGQTTKEVTLGLMRSAIATVVPSRHDALPYVVLESLSLGTPVIGSLTGGIPEIVEDQHSGLLFAVDDDATLARHMLLLIEDRAFRESLAKGARLSFLERYEASRIVARKADRLCRRV